MTVTINWQREVEQRREEIIQSTQEFLRIKSVSDEKTAGPNAPFGEGIAKALDYILHKCENNGFTTKNIEGYAAHAEYGQGEELLGILCHIDVVPEGEGWTSPSYSADIRDGRIYARGAIDDKGPTMAAFYALKLVKDLGLPVNKRIRLIIGTDEESGWQCVERYFKEEEMPTIGFAPDADFPIIYAEKGICNFVINQQKSEETNTDVPFQLLKFEAGQRVNMVPDQAKAVLKLNNSGVEIESEFRKYCSVLGRKGQYEQTENEIVLTMDGVSVHGMEPKKGINAGLILAKFLSGIQVDHHAKKFLTFTTKYFHEDSRGEALGIAISDDITGPLTINVGVLRYTTDDGGTLTLNLRYPVKTNYETMMATFRDLISIEGFEIGRLTNQVPHHVNNDHVLIQTLQRVYTEQTGLEATLISIGGGTYARSLKAGVAFGPLFPGREDTAHQRDEYIEIDDLLKATAIYAQAIYELCK